MALLARLLGPLVGLLLVMQLTHSLPLGSQPAACSRRSRFSDLTNLTNDQRQRRHNSASSEQDGGPTCGYQSCPELESSKLNVHIIAHTHDDVGWLKTVDQYFYGTRKGNSQAGVQFILDSLIPQLLMDREKRFIYVEMSFFVKWWEEQEEDMRNAVKQLVNEGRLEFINGGWCMNDEATVTYHSTIEQMTYGLKFLNETFGACGHPKVGSIDNTIKVGTSGSLSRLCDWLEIKWQVACARDVASVRIICGGNTEFIQSVEQID